LRLIRRQAAPDARGTATRRRTNAVRAGALAVMLLALTGCTNDTFTRIGFPDPVTEQGKVTLSLWQGSWIAGMLVGCVV